MAEMVHLRARKAFRYATRRLLPGDVFDAPRRDARLLLAVRRVSEIRPPVDVPPPPPSLVEQATQPDVAAVRAEYERVMGKRPFLGWDIAELRRRMAAGPDA